MDKELTVFIISFEEETLDECISAIEKQTIKDRIVIKYIKNISPLYKAKNLFYELCETKYFIEVDADMILKANTCEILYNEIKHSNFFTCAVYGQLYEVGFGIGGNINCWKKDFFKYFKYRNIRACDRDIFKRAKRFLLKRKAISVKEPLGVHKPRHSTFSEYLKSKSDVEKWRFLKRNVKKYALPLFNDLIKNPDQNKYKIFGLLLGAITSKERLLKEKDILIENKRLKDLLNIFNYENLEELSININDILSLKNNFIKSYKSYNNKYRNLLINDFVEIFNDGKSNIKIDKIKDIIIR